MTVENQAGATIATLAVNEAAQCWLIDASTAAGVWIARTTTSAVSSPIANAVDTFSLTINNQNNVNIRAMCDAQGYAGTLPARVAVTLRANHIIGSTSNLTPAFDTGTFPALSVITLTVGANSYICGKGGDGGPPGSTVPIIAASNGASGGQSMQVDTDLVLVNYGKIQGGGGGGGGGAGDAGITTTIGARSGGGAGHTIGNGGALPSQIVYPALNGGIESPGVGETIPTGQTGGSGGGPGAVGTAASTGGLGGAAGSAIESKAASPGVLTKLVAGTIDGAEVVT
jgi:hypothetical protein